MHDFCHGAIHGQYKLYIHLNMETACYNLKCGMCECLSAIEYTRGWVLRIMQLILEGLAGLLFFLSWIIALHEHNYNYYTLHTNPSHNYYTVYIDQDLFNALSSTIQSLTQFIVKYFCVFLNHWKVIEHVHSLAPVLMPWHLWNFPKELKYLEGSM